jgi:probable addiction module antidote protein
MKIPEGYSKFDAAEYLDSEEAIAAYLEAAFEEAGEDIAFFLTALGTVARARNMTQLAKDTGISREGLYKALSGDGNPSFDTVVKAMKGMGIGLKPVVLGKRVKRIPAGRKVTARKRNTAKGAA